MSIFIAEWLGTLLLIFLGNGVVASTLLHESKGEKGGWLAITVGWGIAVAVAVYSVGWVSGGHLNPAVTMGLWAAGKTSLHLVPYYLVGQMVGAMMGSALVWIAYRPHWSKTPDPTLKLLCFCTRPAIRSLWNNFMVEVMATAVLLFGILSIFNIHNGIGSGVGPCAVGVLILSIGLSLGGPTGFAINPARDLGPRLMHAWLPIAGKRDSDWGYAWVPIAGPLIGAILGALLYQFVIEPLPELMNF
ncbi:MAG: putative glycerol uptake facilitator protein [Chlamydiota bacterium]|jgi:glycerol uptake facilitator protein